jgi:hypothetical protein
MSKRVTVEESIVEFFNTADTAKVETVFNIVKGVVKRRLNSIGKATKKPVKSTTAAKPTSTETVADAA